MDNFLEKIRSEAERSGFTIQVSEEGTVLSVGDGIVQVAGLRNAKLYELIELESGDCGIVFDIEAESIGIVLLTEKNGPNAGEKAYKTDRIASVNVGESLLGRVVNPLGTPVDGGPSPNRTISYPVERQAPPLTWRDFVNQPLYTGITIIDSMLPIRQGAKGTDHRRPVHWKNLHRD